MGRFFVDMESSHALVAGREDSPTLRISRKLHLLSLLTTSQPTFFSVHLFHPFDLLPPRY